MKNFDDIFAEKVREVFDTYQEPCPEGAWEAFSEKMNRRKRKTLFLPRLAWAAGLALLLSSTALIWFYSANEKQIAQSLPIEQSVQPIEGSIDAKPHEESVNTQFHSQSDKAAVPVSQAANTEKPARKSLMEKNEPTGFLASDQQKGSSMEAAKINRVPEELVEQPLAVIEAQSNDAGQPKEKLAEANVEKNNVVIPDDFLKNQTQLAYEVSKETSVKSESGFDFGMTVSSMMAFSEGSVSNKPGVSGGVLSSFKINNLLGVASGLIVSRHNYQFQGFMAFKNEDMAMGDFQSSYSYENHSDNDFEIVAVDIPLNITFHTGAEPGKGLYFTTGVSSFVYLQEKYSYERTLVNNTVIYSPETGQLSNNYSVERSQVNESHKPLSRFDFARQWNFSMGYLFRLSHGSLAIEPYIKIPLGELTHQGIRLGHGGIGLVYTPQLSVNKK